MQEKLLWPPPPSPDSSENEIYSGVIEMPSGGVHSIMGWLEGLPEHLARLSTAEAAAGQRAVVKSEAPAAAAAAIKSEPPAAAPAAAAAAAPAKQVAPVGGA